MKQYLSKLVVMALVIGGLVAITRPALAWVRVGINVGVPYPVVVTRVLLWRQLQDGVCDLCLSILNLSGCPDTSPGGVPGSQATGGKRFLLCLTSSPPSDR